MTVYKADLHIHTVLSPCGDLEMSPKNIIEKAKEKGLDIIGVTDHNTTLHGALIRKLAKKDGLFVLTGVEITSKEEVHCLAFFENDDLLNEFQKYLDNSIIKIPNNVDKFGYQVIVDANDNIIKQIDYLLIVSINRSIEEIEQEVHSLGGIFILAHIDKKKNSVFSQLGFIPLDLSIDGLELSKHTGINVFLKENESLSKYRFIQSSDAHYINDIGSVFTEIECNELSFYEIKNWFNNK